MSKARKYYTKDTDPETGEEIYVESPVPLECSITESELPKNAKVLSVEEFGKKTYHSATKLIKRFTK